MHSQRLFVIALIVPALVNIGAAQNPPALKTIPDIQSFMQSYYLQPRPQIIAGLIRAIQSSGFAQNAAAVPPVVGFFSEIFAANPDQLSRWQMVIVKQDDQTKAVLNQAVSLSKAGGVLTLNQHSPAINDEYWGAFFASGNPKFIGKLVDQLRFFDEREDFLLFATAATAKWSLASNAQLRPRVRQIIEEAKAGTDKRTQELIDQLLAQGPERVKQEMINIIATEKQSGKWR
jgi:hypothetical protein